MSVGLGLYAPGLRFGAPISAAPVVPIPGPVLGEKRLVPIRPLAVPRVLVKSRTVLFQVPVVQAVSVIDLVLDVAARHAIKFLRHRNDTVEIKFGANCIGEPLQLFLAACNNNCRFTPVRHSLSFLRAPPWYYAGILTKRRGDPYKILVGKDCALE